MKAYIIGLIVAIVLGVGMDFLLWNSHMDFFKADIEYNGIRSDGTNPCAYETKGDVISLIDIRHHEEMPGDCIKSIELTSGGKGLYYFLIIVLPLLIGAAIAFPLKRRMDKKRKA